MGTERPFAAVKRGRSVTPMSRSSRSYNPLSLGACMAVPGQLYFFAFIYSLLWFFRWIVVGVPMAIRGNMGDAS
jgi:hypothetical protein